MHLNYNHIDFCNVIDSLEKGQHRLMSKHKLYLLEPYWSIPSLAPETLSYLIVWLF